MMEGGDDIILDAAEKDKKDLKEKKAKKATKTLEDQHDKTDWNDEEKKHLVVAYAQELAKLGKGAPDNGMLKTSSWTNVQNVFRRKSGKNYHKTVLHSMIAGQKKAYKTMHALR
jgi:hypothetical protein